MESIKIRSWNELEFKHMLTGRSVAVVGGMREADGSLKFSRGIFGDYDLVALVNPKKPWPVELFPRGFLVYTCADNSCPMFDASMYAQAYIVEHGGELARDYWDHSDRHNIPYLEFLRDQYGKTNPVCPTLEWHNVLARKLRTKPLTGITAIAHLLRFPIARLYVTGMDFYQSLPAEQRTVCSVDGRAFQRYNNHDLKPQMDWLAETAWLDLRVQLDDRLSRLVGGATVDLNAFMRP